MATYMQGAIKSGSTPSEYQNVGYATFSQSAGVTTQAQYRLTVLYSPKD
jgi:hypothetical protein